MPGRPRRGVASSAASVRFSGVPASWRVTGEAAVEPVGAEFRRRDVDAQAVAGATEGAARHEPVRPGRQLHVGARDARPVDGKLAAPGQRLAGEAAVAQRELRLDDGTRLHPMGT